ncbi:MAG: dihydroorotase [Chlamydiales bacterium]
MKDNLIALPALIDPHVHFRTPGAEYKEDWKTAAIACICGGVTTVLDMPNNTPACVTVEEMEAKKKLIDAQLKAVDIPLRYGLYLGADQNHLAEIDRAKGKAIALKIFMGSSTGTLLMDDEKALDEAFRRAKAADMLVAVHAEDETLLNATKKAFGPTDDPKAHSVIRPNKAAAIAVKRAIEKAAKYGVRLYILHMSTKEEVALVEEAKRQGVEVYAEVTPHHLFLTIDDYKTWGTKVQMNPPLRTQEDQDALWDAIERGVIDTIGTDHAPHTLAEKERPFGEAPSGVPGVETLLPLMLDAVNRGKLTLERLIELTHTNVAKIFRLPPTDDLVFIDMNLEKRVEAANIKSKCGWTPFEGRVLKGWPLYTQIGGRLISLERVGGKPQFEVCEKKFPSLSPLVEK